MIKKLMALVVIFFTFTIMFLLTTIVTDTICRLNGYYAQGIADSRSVYE